jgi:H+-translocating NAD(P) transhydrogenase subunit alpha
MPVRIGVPRETTPGETRVALVAETVGKLVQAGLAVSVQSGAGTAAAQTDEAYARAGATLVPDARGLYASSDVVLKFQAPRMDDDLGAHEADLLREGSAILSFLEVARNADLPAKFAARRVSAFAMDQLPRISRAQKMDAMSSMSTIAGYKAALLAASSLPRLFPLMMTAAGTLAPARVFVLGAGVAGLQAIATARRIGAVVEAFDVRPAVREEVQSLGATFVASEHVDAARVGAQGYAKELSEQEQQAERALIARHVASADAVITTANVPGRRAPLLVTPEMVQAMKPGAVIVDLAAESGGNCALTQPRRTVEAHGVTIHGPVNLASTVPMHASLMYSRNIAALLQLMVRDGAFAPDFDDEIVRGTCVTRDGRPAELAAAGTRGNA